MSLVAGMGRGYRGPWTSYELDDLRLMEGCAATGKALAVRHAAPVVAVRGWSHADEVALISGSAPASCRPMLERAAALPLVVAPMVPSLGGPRPADIGVQGGGEVVLGATVVLAPAAFDLGSLVAHPPPGRRARAAPPGRGWGGGTRCCSAGSAPFPPDVEAWAALVLTGLAALAEIRDAHPHERDALLDLAAELAARCEPDRAQDG